MEFTAQLDVDVVALEAEDEVTCQVSLTAPVPEEVADRPRETLIAVVHRSGVARGGVESPAFPLSGGRPPCRSVCACPNLTPSCTGQSTLEHNERKARVSSV